jgi:hypothetical protein
LLATAAKDSICFNRSMLGRLQTFRSRINRVLGS